MEEKIELWDEEKVCKSMYLLAEAIREIGIQVKEFEGLLPAFKTGLELIKVTVEEMENEIK